MNRRNVTVLAIVGVLTIGVGLVVYGVMNQPHKVVPPPRAVLVAAMRIPAHAHIVPAMLTVVQKPAEQVDPAALSNPSDALGQIAMTDISEQSPILPGDIAKPPPPPPEVLHVTNGMRAITIPIDAVKGLASLLRPGDRVDIIASPPRGPGEPAAFTIVRDSRVLAVGDTVTPEMGLGTPPSPGAAPTPAPPVPTTATLEVTPAQANLVVSADLNATLRLALRSPREPLNSIPAETLYYSTPQPAPAPASPSKPGPPPGIPVINGDTVQVARP